MTIAEWLTRGKQALQGISRGRRAAAAVVFASAAAFGLGTLASKDWNFGPAEPASASQAAAADAASQSASSTAPAATADAADTGAHTYVASKTGTKFYAPTCADAKRIKPENEVWFATEAAAEAAGYTPSATCKGL